MAVSMSFAQKIVFDMQEICEWKFYDSAELLSVFMISSVTLVA
jgi:hypothetical protein